jgi:hypothetical protein
MTKSSELNSHFENTISRQIGEVTTWLRTMITWGVVGNGTALVLSLNAALQNTPVDPAKLQSVVLCFTNGMASAFFAAIVAYVQLQAGLRQAPKLKRIVQRTVEKLEGQPTGEPAREVNDIASSISDIVTDIQRFSLWSIAPFVSVIISVIYFGLGVHSATKALLP